MLASAATTSLAHEVTLAHEADYPGWRDAARRLLAAQVAPDAVGWRVDPAQPSLFESLPAGSAEATCSVPRQLVQLAELAALHADPDRFALLYRLLWRVTHGQRAILQRAGDRDVTRVEAMAAGVRRAADKLRTLIRFRELRRPAGTHFIAWFEPEHHVVEHVAPWFAEQFGRQRWSIVTPLRSAHGEDGRVWFGPGGHRRDVPPAGADASAWLAWHDAVLRQERPEAQVVPLRPEVASSAPVLVVESLPGDNRGDRAQRLLERALDEAGLDAASLRWVRAFTGGRRSKTVSPLVAERARLRPGLVIALGVRAAEALLERPVALALERGRMLPLDDGSRLLIAGDPAAVLALPDPLAQGREYRRLVGDLLLAVPFQSRAA